jgi:hypothetical protein
VLNWGSGNISEDPLFVDMTTGDLHLNDSSPCIGAGINSFILNEEWFTAPTRDMEGHPRPSPQDSNADMGAYEHEFGFPVNMEPFLLKAGNEAELYQNYPNPFTHTTTFHYQLVSPGWIELSIYNLYGQKVTTLVSEHQSAGTHTCRWDGTGVPGGQYIYRLETGKGFTRSQKLIVLH